MFLYSNYDLGAGTSPTISSPLPSGPMKSMFNIGAEDPGSIPRESNGNC